MQVAPIIAIQSSRSPAGSDAPYVDKYTDDNRFYLLFGTTMSLDSNAQHQRKWINAIHVVLAGAPPVEKDQPEPPGGGSPGGRGESGTGEGAGGAGTVYGGEGQEGGNAQASDAAEGASGEGADGYGASRVGAGADKWSIYQMINPFDNDVANVSDDNPLAPYVAPCAFAMLASGFVECLVRFRIQTRLPQAGFGFAAVKP